MVPWHGASLGTMIDWDVTTILVPNVKAKGDCPGNLGNIILVKVSDKNSFVASIKY